MLKFKGRLDTLIVCHGIFKVGNFTEVNIDQFDETLNVNTRSVFHLVSMASQFLKISKGNVVITTSVDGIIPLADSFLNCLSKVNIF